MDLSYAIARGCHIVWAWVDNPGSSCQLWEVAQHVGAIADGDGMALQDSLHNWHALIQKMSGF